MLRFIRALGDAVFAGAQNETLKAGTVEGANYYAGAMRERFQTASHNMGGDIWPDIKPETKLKRLEQGSGKQQYSSWAARRSLLAELAGIPVPILYITGGIYNSLIPGEANNIMEVDGRDLVYGTANPIAGFHQKGGGRLPQRTILAEPDSDTLAKVKESQVVAYQTLVTELAAA